MADYNSYIQQANASELEAIFDLFDARLQWGMTRTHYVGEWPPTVKVGEGKDDFIPLASIELHSIVPKVELEEARARLFADYLLKQTQETARDTWVKAAKHEPKRFMDQTRIELADLRAKYNLNG